MTFLCVCAELAGNPKANMLPLNNTECVATLVYSANLVRDGSVTFVYRYFESEIIETMFTFEVSPDPFSRVEIHPLHARYSTYMISVLGIKIKP